MFIKEAISIKADLEKTYMAFYDFAVWEKVLDDIEKVNIFYDDGIHQEFSMTVKRPLGLETVKGFRFCLPCSSISLCQTLPPPGFKKMIGEWIFQYKEGVSSVSAVRFFDLLDKSQEQIVSDKLSGFLRRNLSAFKNFLETSE